jgi:F0F1-type ATP synthase assembly protein I
MRFAGLGIQLAVVIVVFVFSGRWLDARLGSEPLFTILLVFVGFGGWMWALIRRLNKENEEGKP